jgi:ectoine hydroxylase-related dioxygenase (phytanoyl-CoA dioxygenase family)
MEQQTPVVETTPPATYALTPQQVRFFESFGFLRLKGIFRDDIEQIESGFEDVFREHLGRESEEVMVIKGKNFLHGEDRHHADPQRFILTEMLQRSPKLSWMQNDYRVRAVASTLVGENYESASSDGSLFYCETSWHPDFYGASLSQLHVKLSFYMEPLRHDSGAIRFLPGTHFHDSPYATKLRELLFRDPAEIRELFGIDIDEIPSYTLESDPGDVVIWNFRTIHASFHGGVRRRLLSINFREPAK